MIPVHFAKPRVLVLSTLHRFHEQVAGYGYPELDRIIRALSPDVLLVEVSGEDLDARADETEKREYPMVVYPLIDALGIQAHPLEPSGDSRAALIRRKRQAEQQLRDSGQYEECSWFLDRWLQDLIASWKTAADANSARTDAAVLAKNEVLDPRYPPDYAQVWDEWNRHFFERITQVLDQTKPRLALVLVGLEHSSWLRPRLARRAGFDLVDAEAVLRDILRSPRPDSPAGGQ